jgi:hypothetical protein
VREKRGDIRLPNLRFIARDLEAHPDLEVAELALKLALLRVLAEPPVKRVSLITTSQRTERTAGTICCSPRRMLASRRT